MIDLINAILIVAGVAIVAIIVAIYVGYITGVIVALAAGHILGVAATLIPQIFAWAYAGLSIVALMLAGVYISK